MPRSARQTGGQKEKKGGVREWIKVVSSFEKTAKDSNLFAKKIAAEQVFGSNLILVNREARLRAPSGLDSVP